MLPMIPNHSRFLKCSLFDGCSVIHIIQNMADCFCLKTAKKLKSCKRFGHYTRDVLVHIVGLICTDIAAEWGLYVQPICMELLIFEKIYEQCMGPLRSCDHYC